MSSSREQDLPKYHSDISLNRIWRPENQCQNHSNRPSHLECSVKERFAKFEDTLIQRSDKMNCQRKIRSQVIQPSEVCVKQLCWWELLGCRSYQPPKTMQETKFLRQTDAKTWHYKTQGVLPISFFAIVKTRTCVSSQFLRLSYNARLMLSMMYVSAHPINIALNRPADGDRDNEQISSGLAVDGNM